MSRTSPTKTFAAAAAAGAMSLGALRAKRRRRDHMIADSLHDTVSPPDLPEPLDATQPEPGADDAHAPGHRHLGPPPRVTKPRAPRIWRVRADKTGHPGRFS